MANHKPFALFALVEIKITDVDKLLVEAYGPYAPCLWLATDTFDDAPKKQINANHGTDPPIPEGFRSTWIGRPADELFEWLTAKPDETDLNDRHFAVLDAGARDDPPTIVVCRFGDLHGDGNKLFMLRKKAMQAVEHLLAAPSDAWDEDIRFGRGAAIRYDDVESGA